MVSILLPLYIYPQAGSWAPLMDAASRFPSVDFTVVVNPASGPGTETLPDENYIDALRSLCDYDNVNMLGYVRWNYGDRALEEIDADIALYGGWEHEFANLDDSADETVSLSGIFVDEMPIELEYLEAMSHITESVRDTWASAMDSEATVMYNPGVVIDPAFYANADYIVAFEDAESERPAFLSEGLSAVESEERGKMAVIVHTWNGSWNNLHDLVAEVVDSGVEALYVTSQVGGMYNEWPGHWSSLVGLVSDMEVDSEVDSEGDSEEDPDVDLVANPASTGGCVAPATE